MYERAAKPETDLKPVWHLDPGRALFAGPLTYNAPHLHSVPVYLAGLDGPFRIKVGIAPWTFCRTAVVPAGQTYAFDVAGAPLAVLYLEPHEAGMASLVSLVRGTREVEGALLGKGGELSVLKEIYETRDSPAWAREALDALMTFVARSPSRPSDPRIVRTARALAARPDAATSAEDAARAVGLSSSRFQHLFAAEIGVPFRKYRSWQRLRAAIGEIVAGSTFTAAAYAAGFSDQAHFARTFRNTFGAPASPSLHRVRKV